MKVKILALVFIIILVAQYNIFADNDLGIRYLKLAHTYLKVDDFIKAEEYLGKAFLLVKKDPYWTAVYYEYLGDYFLLKGNTLKALENYEEALKRYQKIIKQKDGSPVPLEKLINALKSNVNNINPKTGHTLLFIVNNYLNYNCYVKALSFDNYKPKLTTSKLTGMSFPIYIESLSFIGNGIDSIPISIFSSLKNLRILILQKNKITKIPIEIRSLKNLEELDVSYNKINYIPKEIVELKNLKKLNISNTKIKSLPLEIFEMDQLEILDIRNTKIPSQFISMLEKHLPNTLIIK